MNFKNKIPHFSYIVSSPYHQHNNCILVDGDVIHHIDNLSEFYESLGYTNDMQKAGIEPELYRWDEFTKDNAVESAACLQMCIIEYLNKNSATFRQRYENEYKSWAGSCSPENLMDTNDCKSCYMHPSNKNKDSGDII